MKFQARFRQYLTVSVFFLCCTAAVANTLSNEAKTRVLDATVFIEAEDRIGNGFFVAPYRIVTGAHLVEGLRPNEIRIKGYKTNEIRCIRVDQIEGFLALLEVDTLGSVPDFADKSTIRPGEPIYIFGYPGGRKPFYKRVEHSPNSHEFCELGIKYPLTIESDGGPVVNVRGELLRIHFAGKGIGVGVGIKSESSFSFVLPIDRLHRYLEGREVTISPSLSISCQDLREKLKQAAEGRKLAWEAVEHGRRGLAEKAKVLYKKASKLYDDIPWKRIRRVFRIIF